MIKEQKKNMILTHYGETDKYEVHAELFTAYATNRTALANYNQGLVDYMDNLLEEATKKHNEEADYEETEEIFSEINDEGTEEINDDE